MAVIEPSRDRLRYYHLGDAAAFTELLGEFRQRWSGGLGDAQSES
jgi:hypothetical protein